MKIVSFARQNSTYFLVIKCSCEIERHSNLIRIRVDGEPFDFFTEPELLNYKNSGRMMEEFCQRFRVGMRSNEVGTIDTEEIMFRVKETEKTRYEKEKNNS